MKTTDLFTPRLVPGLAFVVAVALLGAGCGGGGTAPAPINDPPTLSFQTPTLDQEGPVGLVVDVKYTADDPDDEAMTSLYADRDGDFATKGDQIPIIQNRVEDTYTFLDLLKLLGYRQLTVSDGHSYAHQITIE